MEWLQVHRNKHRKRWLVVLSNIDAFIAVALLKRSKRWKRSIQRKLSRLRVNWTGIGSCCTQLIKVRYSQESQLAVRSLFLPSLASVSHQVRQLENLDLSLAKSLKSLICQASDMSMSWICGTMSSRVIESLLWPICLSIYWSGKLEATWTDRSSSTWTVKFLTLTIKVLGFVAAQKSLIGINVSI